MVRRIVDTCTERGYPLKQDRSLNLVGVEGINLNGTFNDDRPDKWNDMFTIIQFKSDNPVIVSKSKCTTEPSDRYTRNPLNANGAARLDTGFHKNLWQVGSHRGYKALVQGGNVARLVRDANRNHRRDDRVTYETHRGINWHTTKTTNWSGSASPESIGSWSAGCTVVYDPNDFVAQRKLILNSDEVQKNPDYLFDYILLWSRWLGEKIKSVGKVDFSTSDLDTLARTVYGEARGESVKGKTAVAWTIRNRAEDSPKYGWSSNIAQVCKQPWQYSCWNQSDPNYNKLINLSVKDAKYLECKEIAEKVLKGELADPTNGADHYYATYIAQPSWAKGQKVIATIGTHVFFNIA